MPAIGRLQCVRPLLQTLDFSCAHLRVCEHSLAFELYVARENAQAITVCEEYARTKAQPSAYHFLLTLYMECDEKNKALKRGVAEHDPVCVVAHVRCAALLPCSVVPLLC
jgi:hypothetical protein